MAFPSRAEYEALVYGVPEDYPDHVQASTLRLYSRSALTVVAEGEIRFLNGLTLKIINLPFNSRQINLTAVLFLLRQCVTQPFRAWKRRWVKVRRVARGERVFISV